MKNFKLFKNVVCNCILGVVIVSIVAISFFSGIVSVSSTLKPTSKGLSKTNVGLMIALNKTYSKDCVQSTLNLLSQNGITATFFVSGVWAVQNEELLKKIHSQGHEIGNQGFYDLNHKTLSQQRCVQEINITHRLIKEALGIEMTLFTPPNGLYSESTLLAAAAEGYKTVIPTNDTMDIRDNDKALIYKRATKNVSGGTMILIHPTLESVDALGDILYYVLDKGFIVSTVSKALESTMI